MRLPDPISAAHSSSSAASTPGASTPAWQDIEELLHEIAALAQAPRAREEFCETVCRHVARVAQASATTIWLRSAAGRWTLAGTSSVDVPAAPAMNGSQLHKTAAVSIPVDTAVEGRLECHFEHAVPAYVNRMLEAVAELVADFFRQQRLEELNTERQQWKQFAQLVTRIHGSLDVDLVAYQVVNEGRGWLGVDRMSLLFCTGGTARLLAMSGVDRVERRADLVRSMEQLAGRVAATGEPLFHGTGVETLAPELEDRLHALLEHSPARTLAVLPLIPPDLTSAEPAAQPRSHVTGVLLVENFEATEPTEEFRSRLQALLPQAATALENARRHERLPLARWMDRWSAADKPWLLSKTALVLAAVGLTALALVLIPADFSVEARGELQPAVRKDIFAPADGVIQTMNVSHGSAVSEGLPLLVLSRSPLDLETARVEGELQTAIKKLAATQALKLATDRTPGNSVVRSHQLTAEEEELKEQIRGLTAQAELLAAERAALTVRSPLDGTVLTWNVESLLASRPVARGQHLLTVADLSGDWELDLQVPDDRMGHVLAASRAQAVPLDITYVVATDPAVEYQTTVGRIAGIAEAHDGQPPGVELTAPVGKQAVADARPGAEVIARIHCGRRSLGYVWFHDLIDAVRSWLWF